MRSVDSPNRNVFAVGCLALLSLAWCGCALPRQASERLAAADESTTKTEESSEEEESDEPVKAKPVAKPQAESDADTTKSDAARGAEPKVDPVALAVVMGQLQELRALDPPAHDQLLADLKHVDPKLWPMLVQGFKASVEYRQRKQTPAIQAAGLPPDAAAAHQGAHAPRSPGNLSPPPARPAQVNIAQPPVATSNEAPATQSKTPEVQPAVAAVVQPVSHETARPPADWRQPLEATIRSLEAALAESPGPADDDRQVSLRLLYLLSGQRDKALRPLTGHDALAQEFWSREIYALSTYLDAQRVSDRSRRAAEAALHHWEASNRLSQQGNLLVRNLAFCTEVMSYGVYTPFERLEFRPGQRVLLYAEVENFVSQATPRGHHTALRTSYQIFDSRGGKVEDHEFPLMEEHCQNPRRDFFIAYEAIRLPAQIYDGKYTLKLSIEDTLGKKVGQSSLDFHVKQAAANATKR